MNLHFPARPAIGLAAVLLLAGAVRADVRTAAELRSMSDRDARRRMPVTLHGVVTFANKESGDLYIQDPTGGCAIRPDAVRAMKTLPSLGAMVEVSGVTEGGHFVPVVAAGPEGLRLTGIGESDPPAPVLLSSVDLEGGEFDARRVAVKGVVRTIRTDRRTLRLELGTRVGRLTLLVPDAADQPHAHLLNARVRAEGVLRAIANSRRQWVGNMLLVPRLADLVVEVPPPSDPFSLPESRVDELSRVANSGVDASQVKVHGTVTFHTEGFRFFLRTANGTIEVLNLLGWRGGLKPGDVVDVVGYPVLVRKRVVLHDAAARVVGRDAPPQPRALTPQQVLEEDCDGELVAIEGRLVQATARAGYPLLLLDADGTLVEATCAVASSRPDHARLRALPVGAKLRVSGIAEIDGAMQLDGSVRADGLSIALRDADDALVLVPPPFWTTSRLLAAIGLLGATLALFAVWSAMLRRRVQQQTAIIRDNVRREAVWEERSRIAQDIHDDVGAALTQISLLGELGRREGATAETMMRQLGKVVQKSRDAVRALDEIVWTVNPVNDSLEKAVSYLCQTAQDLLRETPIRCRLQVDYELPPGTLGAKVRHNLFLAIKEALNNAVKHSGASELRFGLALEAGRLKVTIEDDGRGFDPVTANRARNGLSNMARRLADAGGSVRLDSAPGRGTRIVFEVPVQRGDTSFER